MLQLPSYLRDPKDQKLEVIIYRRDDHGRLPEPQYSVYVRRKRDPKKAGAPLGIFCCLLPTSDQEMASIVAAAYRSLILTKQGRARVLWRARRDSPTSWTGRREAA
jgi:hypothetical protein